MLSDAKIVALYCFTDDLLKVMGHREDCRIRVSDAEVLTTAFVSHLYFSGHHDNARRFMQLAGYVPRMLHKSTFSRRVHRLSFLLQQLFESIGSQLEAIAGATEYVLDSFPVPVCDNIRIARSRLLRGPQWRGKWSAMRRYFYGVKVQVLTLSGIPVEFTITPGAQSDVKAWGKLPLRLAPESVVYADCAYTSFITEDDAFASEAIRLAPERSATVKTRKDSPWVCYLKEQKRKGIETTFSQIKARMPRHIHATTANGFFLKTALFLISYTLDKLTN